jgi:hypothetical protein
MHANSLSLFFAHAVKCRLTPQKFLAFDHKEVKDDIASKTRRENYIGGLDGDGIGPRLRQKEKVIG